MSRLRVFLAIMTSRGDCFDCSTATYLLVFVRFSDDRWFAVFFALVFIILIIVVVRVAWRYQTGDHREPI